MSLVITDLSKRYGEVAVFSHVSLTVASGEFVAILGESGVGKSTLLNCMAGLDSWEQGSVLLDGLDVSDAIRTEEAGMNASKVSVLPAVRQALVDLQHGFARLPGLLADGRDMGTVIFPKAPLKVFLTASAEKRAERRHKQLISKGFSTTISALRADLEARDARDTQRSVAPLKPAPDAMHLDNSSLSIDESVAQVLNWWQSKQVFGSGRT